MVQRDFQRGEGVSDSRSNSGTGRGGSETVRDYSAVTSVIHFQTFIQCIKRKGYRPGEAYEKTGRMNALYGWQRDSLEGPHDAEAMVL